ncbi:uncharacterized protein SCODWIG_01278 [Saccharomycodes ludwigii]|uniref:3',5'-cyclic-nucleotide phosphodiesterase 1 n=1 Tax=Saccharomycodes ludwigii TaxID=36035 RepID=A0A376B4A9_9ASCO|nr:hypothetical protein SCDLUD_002257 [Saccharomycodes ludwigii]KAH3900804.1 hypothetical protein SCDLUD_002257 [Saccharomycodes ludwigii]SSD59517.1 uncharacterized protein SCODWIG_01278 [Saccharomycodes ludwigii]
MFEVIVLGSSGGPFETQTQCFLVRLNNCNNNDSNNDEYISFDGGCGLNAIAKLFTVENKTYTPEIDLYCTTTTNTSKMMDLITDKSVNVILKSPDIKTSQNSNILSKTLQFYGKINKFFITHAHLDHISGFIINTPILYDQLYNDLNQHTTNMQKTLYGLETTVRPITENIFNCKIWPNLLAIKTNSGDAKISSEILIPGKEYVLSSSLRKNDAYSIVTLPLRHGTSITTGEIVFSSVYILFNHLSSEMLFVFGDCESDPTYLNQVWEYATSKTSFKIKGIFIECSMPDDPSAINDPNDPNNGAELYGHMSPYYLICELEKLIRKIQSKGNTPFILNIFITHVKQNTLAMATSNTDNYSYNPKLLILEQLKCNARKRKLDKILKFSILMNDYTYYV